MDNNGWNNGQNNGQNNDPNNGWNQNDENQYNQNQYNGNPYGQYPYGQNPYGQNGNNTGNNLMGIVSMILGFISMVMICGCYLLSIPLGISAIVTGIISIRKNEMQRGLAIAGIITGVFGILISIALVIIVIYMHTSGIYERIMNEFYMDSHLH